jgi:hypothetical protein
MSELLELLSGVHVKLVTIENNVAELVARIDRLEDRIAKMDAMPDVVVEKVVPRIKEVLKVVG